MKYLIYVDKFGHEYVVSHNSSTNEYCLHEDGQIIMKCDKESTVLNLGLKFLREEPIRDLSKLQ